MFIEDKIDTFLRFIMYFLIKINIHTDTVFGLGNASYMRLKAFFTANFNGHL